MSPKTIYKLTLILLALVGLWYAQKWWQNRQLTNSSSFTVFNADAQADQITKITLTADAQILTLTKGDAFWKVNEASASAAKVDELLAILKQPQLELVSQNPDRFPSLGIADNLAKQLQYWQGETTKATIFVASPSGQLIRKKDTSDVYRLSSPLYLTTSATDWQAPAEPAAP